MKKRRGKLLAGALLLAATAVAASFVSTASAAPVTQTITVPDGVTSVSIDLPVNEATPYVANEYQLTVSDPAALTFASFEPKLTGASSSPQISRDGVQYFGYFSGSYQAGLSTAFPAGPATAGTVSFTGYTGVQPVTVTITVEKVTRIDSNNKSVTTTIEQPYVFTVQREGTSQSASAGTTTPAGNTTTPAGNTTTPAGNSSTAAGTSTTPAGNSTTPAGNSSTPSAKTSAPVGNPTSTASSTTTKVSVNTGGSVVVRAK